MAATVEAVAAAAPTDARQPDGRPGRIAPDVLGALVENHRRFLAFLEKRVESREVAEDILQDGFVLALQRGGEIRDAGSSVAWFYRLLRNAVTDHYRGKGAAARALARVAGMEESATEIDDKELFATVCGCVSGLLETLKPEYAAALREIELGGRSVAEYAAGAGISANNAAVRVHRAREALRKQLIRCCGTCLEHGCEDCRCSH